MQESSDDSGVVPEVWRDSAGSESGQRPDCAGVMRATIRLGRRQLARSSIAWEAIGLRGMRGLYRGEYRAGNLGIDARIWRGA